MADSSAELDCLLAEKEELKTVIRQHRDAGADPDVIAPIFNRYLAVKARADALAAAPPGSSPAATAVVPELAAPAAVAPAAVAHVRRAPTLTELADRKAELKENVRVAKANGVAAADIEPIYAEYLRVRDELERAEAAVAAAPASAPGPAPALAGAAASSAVGVGAGAGAGAGDGSSPRPLAAAAARSTGDLLEGTQSLEKDDGSAVVATNPDERASSAAASAVAEPIESAAASAAAVEARMAVDSGDQDSGPTTTEGWLDCEESKTFGGPTLRRRYCMIADGALVIYKDDAQPRGKEKARIALMGTHVRPVLAAVEGSAASGFEILSKRALSKTDVFIAGMRETAKAWFRGVWREMMRVTAARRAALFVPNAPLGFNGRVLHMEWMQVHLLQRWVWRFCVLSDFALSYYDEFPTKSEALSGAATKIPRGTAVAGAFGLIPHVGALRREPQKDYGLPHVFVLTLSTGEKLPLACYSAERLQQWVTGLDITARRALQASLDAGELAFVGTSALPGQAAPIAVEIVVASMSRLLMRRALTREQRAAAAAAAANPLLHADLEDGESTDSQLIWQHAMGNLRQFRRERFDLLLDFGQNEPSIVRFSSESTYAFCNVITLVFLERAHVAARKTGSAAKGPS